MKTLQMKELGVDENIIHLNQDIARIMEKAKVARAQATSEIIGDIRKMINNPNYADVVFLCKDGARIHASRLLLVARSAVFHRMLLNRMVESQLSEIPLKEISSTALFPVMEFLYTGALQEYAPKDWKNAYEIIGTARFFLLEGLELIAVDYLLLATTEVGVDIKVIAEFLSIAAEFVGTFGETVDLVVRNLVCILESTSLRPEHLQALTKKAFRYFLEITKNKDREFNLFSTAEFLRLKTIVLWCACERFSPKEPSMSHTLPIEIESTLQVLEKSPYQQTTGWKPFEIYNSVRPSLVRSLKQYLPLVNLRRIDPELLVGTFEPLNILPSSAIMDAFRFHALHWVERYHYAIAEETHSWSTGSENLGIYKMGRDRSVIQKVAPGIGFARYSLPIPHTGWARFTEWEIIIEEACEGFIEIGFHHNLDGDGELEDGQSLSGQPGGWALRMDPRGLSINRDWGTPKEAHQVDVDFVSLGKYKYDGGLPDCSQLIYGQDYANKNSKVNVCLLMYEKECCVTMNDDEPGALGGSDTVWHDIPYGTLYPAVSLGTGSSGRVRIRILGCDVVY